MRAARTPAELARAAGRAVLWCLVAVLLLRGAGDVLATPSREPAPVAQRAAPPEWPDDEARAFAVRFARAYLGYSGEAPGELLAFAAPDLADSIVPEPARGPAAVEDAVVARAERLDEHRALLTVAAVAGSRTRYLTVPVARDADGGLVVFDLPAFAAPPAHARLEPAAPEPLTGTDAQEVEDVLRRFFRGFLAGRSDELTYLVPAGARVEALEEPLALAGVDSVSELEPARGDTRSVLATVRARDPATGARYELRYRVRLVRGDRLYIAEINTTGKEG